MPPTIDLEDDFADVTDGLEAVTLARPGSSQSAAVSGALRRGLSRKEAEMIVIRP